MKAYKGFNKDMTCRGFQYKEGETYETNKASLCRKGFHACLDPLNTFTYYQPSNSIYHEVEVDDGAEREENGDSKVASRTIKIGARLSIKDLVTTQIGLVIERSKGDAYSSGDGSSAATSGDGSSAATSGEESSAATDHANGIALANGKNSRARGAAGSWLVLTEWSDDQAQLLTVKAVQVDGEKVKPGIFYKLSGGNVVEAEGLR